MFRFLYMLPVMMTSRNKTYLLIMARTRSYPKKRHGSRGSHHSNPRARSFRSFINSLANTDSVRSAARSIGKSVVTSGSKRVSDWISNMGSHRGSTTHVNKREPKQVEVGDVHSGIDASTFRVKLHKYKLPKSFKSAGRFTYTQNQTGTIIGNEGKQSVVNLIAANMRNQFITATGVPYNYNQSARDYLSMDPNQKNTGSTIAGGATAAFPATNRPANQRIMVLKNDFQIEITNFSSVAAYVDIYMYVAKRNGQKTPIELWDDQNASDAFGNSVAGYPTSGNKTGTIGYQPSDYPGEKPTKASLVKRHFKLLTVKDFKLGAAATETWNVLCTTNKGLNVNSLTDNTDDWIAGMSIHFIAVVRGQLVEDVAVTDGTGATYGPTRIGYAVKHTVVLQNAFGPGSLSSRLAVTTAPAGNAASSTNIHEVSENDVQMAPPKSTVV